MRPRALLAAAVILGASTIRAQEVRQQNKTFVVRSTTPAENWTAALRLAHFQAIAGFAYAKRHGATAEMYGRELGEFYASTWSVDS